MSPSPSPAQLRAARAWLGWSRAAAAHRAGLHEQTVSRLERGERIVTAASRELLRAAYTTAGLAFLGSEGIGRTGAPSP